MNNRLLSLDVFRGLTIAGMILVNNPGSWNTIYAPLRHARWHGATPTDWIFPFFLFIVGVAIPLALGRRLERGDDRGAIVRKILRRTLLIFVIGLVLNAFPFFDLSTVRIPGVLQRIALVYGVCALLFVYTRPRTQWIVAGGLLLFYWGLMTLVPVPGGYPPNLEADTNLGAWLDRTLMEGHLWSQSRTWDPEGLLSTLPAVVTGLSGIFTGRWMLSERPEYEKLSGLFIAGTLCLAAGLMWNELFPINKQLWTSSFVLYTNGLALLLLGLTYWAVDLRGWRTWAQPFVVFGSNALFVFVLSGLLAELLYTIRWANTAGGDALTLKERMYDWGFTPYFSAINASLAFALVNVFFFLLLSWILYQRRIFIKV